MISVKYSILKMMSLYKKKVENLIFTHTHISSHYKRRIIAQGQKWAKFNFLIVC